jgi:hypothetical protein
MRKGGRYNCLMPQSKPTNPFYAALLVVGVVFAITACAYCVMTVRGLEPRPDEQGLMGVMSQHGLTILVVELVLLGVLTFAAIGTDEYWTRRAGQGTGSRGSEVGGRESGNGKRAAGNGERGAGFGERGA